MIPAALPSESGWTASGDGALSLLKALWHQGDMPNAGGSSGLATSQVALLQPSAQGNAGNPSPQAPSLTITSNALTVTGGGGSVALPISASPAVQGDPLVVTISGLANYETLTDGLDHHVFSGNTVTLTAAEVASGLTLTSNYTGPDHPVNTLSVTATELMDHHVVTSPTDTITVTDPPPAKNTTTGTSGTTTSTSGTSTGTSGNPLTLQVSGDNLNGTDPQFEVFVDGHQVGGIYTATADHASGQTQTITINGNFDPLTAHQVQIQFINDAWDGTSWWGTGAPADGHDVNLYVESISFNNTTMTGAQGTNGATNGVLPATIGNEAVMDVDGTLTFNVPADPPASPGTVTGGTVNTGSGGSGTSSGTGTGPSTGAGAPPSGPGFFVSPNGNDGNAGTVNAPFATLERAQQAMENSSIKTTYVEGGTYHLTNSLTLTAADNGETWTYYPPNGVDTAILDGGGSVYNLINVFASNVTIDGLQFEHSTNSGVEIDGPNHNGGFTTTNNTIINNVFHDITNTDGAPVAIWGATNTKVFNNLIYNVNSKGIGVETWAGDNSSGTDIENNVLLNTNMVNNDNGAIYIQDLTHGNTTDVTVKNNFIRDYGSADRFNKGIYLDDGASNTTVTGNVITGSGQYAFQYHGGDNNVVSGNIIDLGSSGNQFVAIYQDNGMTNMAGNTFTGNVIINGGSSVSPAWFDLTGGDVPPTVADNVYFNASGGPTSTSGGNIADTSPIFENPQLSGWTYAAAAGSPVHLIGGWGPPGYIIAQSGTAPSV